MFGSEILDVAIGLALIFMLLSLIASALRESLEGWFKSRALYLERGIFELLKQDSSKQENAKAGKAEDEVASWLLAASLYRHPAVYGLYRGDYSAPTKGKRTGRWWGFHELPAYIPASSFATALLDIVVRGDLSKQENASATSPPLTVANVRNAIGTLNAPRVQRAILTALDMSGGDIAKAQANVEAWFNSSMDRVSGWYKRRTQHYLFLIGLVIAFALNVNTITIARYFYRDKAAREAIVASASRVAGDSGVFKESLDTLLDRVDALHLPIGWSYTRVGVPKSDTGSVPPPPLASISGADFVVGGWDPLFAIAGWLITALAVSLGAPFWFDLLNKFMVIRSTVKPHEKSGEEGSEDRQDKLAAQPTTTLQIGTGSAAGASPAVNELPPDERDLLKQLSGVHSPAVGL